MKFKNSLKKVAASVVVAMLLVGCLSASALAETTYIRGTFQYAAAENDGNLPDTFAYSDEYFAESADTTNLHLAIMSLQMGAASMSANHYDYPEKSKFIVDLMTKIGLEDVEVNEDYKSPMKIDTLGVAVGHKKLSDGSVLLTIIPRSAGYEDEWANNLIVGESGMHAGFKSAREKAYKFVQQYVDAHADAFEGQNVKVWTAGYSRGASMSNVIAAGIVDDSQTNIGLDVPRENVYSYNFGCAYTTTTELASARNYNNIHNYASDGDLIAMTPPAAWGLARYGTTTTVNSSDPATKEEMLSLLKDLNANVYNEYIDNGDPDYFTVKKISLDGGSWSIVDDDSKQVTQVDFLNDRINQLVKATDDRATYAEHFQVPASQLIMLFKTNGNFTSGLVDSMKNTDSGKKLLVSMFFYSLVDQAADKYKTDDETAMGVLQLILYLYAPGTETDDETMNAILASDEWKQVYEKLAEFAAQGKAPIAQLLSKYEDFMAGNMKTVLMAALEKGGKTGDDLNNHPLLQDGAPLALAKMFSYLMFGTDDELPTTIDEAVTVLSNKASAALTLYSNYNRVSRVHDNDVMISWLRAEDPDPIPDADPEPEPDPDDPEPAPDSDDSDDSDEPSDSTSDDENDADSVVTQTDAKAEGDSLPMTGDSAPVALVAMAALAGVAFVGARRASRKPKYQ